MKPELARNAAQIFQEHGGDQMIGVQSSCRALSMAALMFSLAACGSLPRNPIAAELITEASVPGMPPEARAIGFGQSAELQRDFSKAMIDGGAAQACDQVDGHPVFCVLIVSGGGGSGAYGAGLLNGWTKSGTRPEFKIVTGVSTGGLIAPFAFLGPDWDAELKQAYTMIEGNDDVIETRSIFGILQNDSVATVEPFAAKLEEFVTPQLVEAVAREHESGRRLYIGTTNLDAQTFTVWNMGAIASVGGARSVETFRKVLLASASIPILMPPVLFEVKAKGDIWDEMHADGGVQAQFFVPLRVINLPEAIKSAQAGGFGLAPRPRMYVIRNARFTPDPKPIERSLPEIAGRTISTMIQAMGRSDLYQIFAIARARGNDFRYTEVPSDFVWNSDQEFDGPEMRRLFKRGEEIGQQGDFWAKTPPGLFAQNTAKPAH